MLPACRLALWGVLADRAAPVRLLDFWALLGLPAALLLLRDLDFALADLLLVALPVAVPPLVWLPFDGPPADLLTGVVPRSPPFAISDNRPCRSDSASTSIADAVVAHSCLLA